MFPFLRRKQVPGSLFQSGEKILDCTYKLEKGTLIFTSTKEERSFQTKKIYKVFLENETLFFSFFEHDYSFKGSNLKSLFGSLNEESNKEILFESSVLLSVYENGRFCEKKDSSVCVTKEFLFFGKKQVLKNEVRDFYFQKQESSLVLSYFLTSECKEETVSLVFTDFWVLLKFLSFVKVAQPEEICGEEEVCGEDDFESEEISEEINEKNEVKNDGLLGAKNNLLFVSRGDALGIFQTNGEEINFRETITNGLQDSLSKMKLYNNNLLLQDKDTKSLKILDFEKQKITEKIDTKNSLKDFFNEEDFVGGISENALLNFDLRSKNVVVGKKEYKVNPKFTVGGVNDKKIVLGSENGDLRFYDSVGKKAKELIRGFGSKPISVDQFGKFTLATYKEYLLLIYEKKQVKLSLKPHHVSFLKEEVFFTAGKFSPDGERILTSTNNYVVVWKVSDVIGGNLLSYRIKQFGDKVVANTFSLEDPNSILLALPDDVRKTGTSALWSLEKEIYKRKE